MSYRGVRHATAEVTARLARRARGPARVLRAHRAILRDQRAMGYSWLSTIVAVSVGDRLPNGATDEVFEVL
jgi:hypothetical protein